jgi:hypothetical protein
MVSNATIVWLFPQLCTAARPVLFLPKPSLATLKNAKAVVLHHAPLKIAK